MYPMLVDEATA